MLPAVWPAPPTYGYRKRIVASILETVVPAPPGAEPTVCLRFPNNNDAAYLTSRLLDQSFGKQLFPNGVRTKKQQIETHAAGRPLIGRTPETR